MQGPDIRPKALGLWPLFGLGDQVLLLLQPCLPAVLLNDEYQNILMVYYLVRAGDTGCTPINRVCLAGER